MKDYNAYLDYREKRRFQADDRRLGKLEKMEIACKQKIGELANGKYYAWLGDKNGKSRYKFSDNYSELCQFLVRNKYVRV